MNKYLLWAVLFLCVGSAASLHAQRTVEFRITTITSNIGDMDGTLAGDSDPQWDFAIEDICGEQSGSGSRELSGTNCPGTTTINNTFFSGAYDCDLPDFRFTWRGFEDDGVSSDANTGDISFVISGASLTSSTFTNVTTGTYSATVSGTRCGGGTTVTWSLVLQYRVTGTRAACTADQCATPLVLPSPQQYRCGGTQTSTALNTTITARQSCGRGSVTPSASSITCSVERTPPQDIWVKVRIPDSTGGAVVQFENLGGCTGFLCVTNVTYAWYTSTNGTCSGLTYRGCDAVSCFLGCGNGEIRVDGRAGEDVWIRIWEEDDQGFSIRFNQITPTAPADRCYTALPLAGTGCNYQATSPTTGLYPEPSIASWTAAAHPGGVCQDGDHNAATNTVWASNENLVWYTYTQNATGPFSIAVDNMVCAGGAASAQLGLFRNTGTAASPVCNLATTTGMGCAVGVGAVELVIPSLPAGSYVLVVDGNAGAQCSWVFRDRIGGTLLPVRWIGFEGKMSESKQYVELNWQTVDEDINRGFYVQRSLDGVVFEELDFIEANGTGSYLYHDAKFPTASMLYYRLRQLDADGQAMHSKVIAITTHLGNSGVSVLHDPFPNPAVDQLTVPFYTNSPDKISAWIYDASGRVVVQAANQQEYSEGQHFLQIALPSDLAAGIYTIRFQTGQGTQIKRFAKY